MLITKEVPVKWHSKTKKYYENLGYIFTKYGDEFIVKIEHLSKGSHTKVEILCDYCKNTIYKEYKTYVIQNEKSTINKDCCVQCSKLKRKESNLIVYGKENVFQVKEYQDKYKKTLMNKYGVNNVSEIDEVKEKKKRTSMEHFGVEYPLQNKIIQEKAFETNLKKYGVKNYTQSKEYIEKTIKTNREKYGVDWVNQNEEIRQKYKSTCIEKYGVDNYFKTEEFNKKCKDTMNRDYGVNHYTQTDEFKIKSKNTSLEHYGVEYPMQSQMVKNKFIETNLKKYGVKYPIQNPKIKSKAIATLHKNGKAPTSSQQLKIFNMLKDNGYKVELNYPLSRINLDVAIFIGDIKIDLEYDGIYWHQDVQKDRKRDEFTKSRGWKILRIKSRRKTPNIDDIVNAINKLITTDVNFAQIVLDDISEVI